MPMRSFSLNSDEAYDALCPRTDEPWIHNGALPPEPRWGEQSDPLSVSAETEGEAKDAARAWLAHVARSAESK